MKITLRLGEESRALRVLRRGDRIRLSFEDGREIEARLLASGGGGFELELGRERIHGAGAVLGPARRQIWVNGRTLEVERLERRSAAREAAGEAGLSVAIPALVVEVLVREGETVSAGQKLVLLESMKMVLPIQAPHDGIVRALHCQPGQAVEAGLPLVSLDPLPPAGEA